MDPALNKPTFFLTHSSGRPLLGSKNVQSTSGYQSPEVTEDSLTTNTRFQNAPARLKLH